MQPCGHCWSYPWNSNNCTLSDEMQADSFPSPLLPSKWPDCSAASLLVFIYAQLHPRSLSFVRSPAESNYTRARCDEYLQQRVHMWIRAHGLECTLVLINQQPAFARERIYTISLCACAGSVCRYYRYRWVGWVSAGLDVVLLVCLYRTYVHSLSFSRVAAQRGWNFNEMTRRARFVWRRSSIFKRANSRNLSAHAMHG
jgi:hypothetical protein